MRIIILAGLLMVLAALPSAAQEGEAVVTLERTACFGRCPVYSLTLHEDGRVVFEGRQHVEVEGKQAINIGAEAFEALLAVIDHVGYFDWDDEYTTMTVTDHPSVITSVTRNGETKRINHYTGDESAPLELSYLENWIDRVANTQQWTGQQSSLPYTTFAGLPLIALERGVCFGTCPVYTVTIYRDGTVVFMGFDHVSQIGIHVGSIDAEAVAQLAAEITEAGYFEWEDEYTEQAVSDLPTVITTVMTVEGYKRIIHDLGDPSAPEALVAVETMIDSAADVAQWIVGPEETPTPSA